MTKSQTKAVSDYLAEIKRKRGGDATEFTYRTPLENLLNALSPKGVFIVQEPSRKQGIGAPDFRVSANSGAIIGYAECKKPGEDLHSLARGAQVKKYKNLSPNILLTDYWNFIFLHDGAAIPPVSLRGGAKNAEELVELLARFLRAEPQKIGDAETLARALAERCRVLRTPLAENIKTDDGRLRGIFNAFQETVYRDIDETVFADALAQTLVFGLLTAKLNMNNGGALQLHTVKRYIPQNFALLREIADFLDELDESQYAGIKYLVDDILLIVNHMDAAAVAESMSYRGGKKNGDDPYLHFYENFLAAYDAKLREARGVYYTPPPVVRFIVRAANDILRDDFGLPEGLADEQVTALDFAAGTGTFMLEMFRLAFGDSDPARRDTLAHKHLLKNFFGFELLLAPFAIAHLKLSQFLKDSGVSLDENRVNVFLTNTLDRVGKMPSLDFMPALAEETKRAEQVKERRILVITGNPPYSGVSQNKSASLSIKKYKDVDGAPMKERASKWLQDDYVKFVRFAQCKIDEAGEGVVAIITNHAFLDNPTFRGMRQSLMKTFDCLYFLDLHGNAKKRERAPDGGKDENVFDIQQGVVVSLFVKKKELNEGVFHADLFGTRAHKYAQCEEQTVDSVRWKKIEPKTPFYLFVPRDERDLHEYERFYSVKDIFTADVCGVVTSRDPLCIHFTDAELEEAMRAFADLSIPDAEIRRRFGIGDNSEWKLTERRAIAARDGYDKPAALDVLYRPFDVRSIYYHDNIVLRRRYKIMRHMLAGDNLGLVTVRQVAEKNFNHVIVADNIVDFRMTLSNRGGAYLFPLYRHDAEVGGVVVRENFKPEFRRWIDARYGKKHSPEKILGCIYAILHSPQYREQYAEFLRMDFPRIPFPKENAEFLRLAKIGGELIQAHLLKTDFSGGAELRGDGTTHRVEKVHYAEKGGRLYFNKDEYFAPLSPEVFNFQIGGYKPLDKFLKSRKGRTLSGEEIDTIERAAAAIAFTLRKQKQIDG